MLIPQSNDHHIELIARALIVYQSHALMCRSTTSGHYYLPGGHIEFAEPASQALKRELVEETGQQIAVGPLLLTTENTFNDGKQDHHEINLVFHAELADSQLFHVEQLGDSKSAAGGSVGGLPKIESREPHIAFEWIDLAAVGTLDIRPMQIRAWLASGGRIEGGGDSRLGIPKSAHLVSCEIPVPTADADG
tara:strand:+ start:5298 stop:5873 length:576 start_codon:yes stop_codon:yes gene_type:complete